MVGVAALSICECTKHTLRQVGHARLTCFPHAWGASKPPSAPQRTGPHFRHTTCSSAPPNFALAGTVVVVTRRALHHTHTRYGIGSDDDDDNDDNANANANANNNANNNDYDNDDDDDDNTAYFTYVRSFVRCARVCWSGGRWGRRRPTNERTNEQTNARTNAPTGRRCVVVRCVVVRVSAGR